MSFEAFIFCFKEGEPAGFPTERIRAAFGPFASDGPDNGWRLYYDERNYSDVTLMRHPTDERLILGFTVERPCGDSRLWDALASILALNNLVLIFPAGLPPLIASDNVVQHLPAEMIESMGQPRYVRSGAEILRELHKA